MTVPEGGMKLHGASGKDVGATAVLLRLSEGMVEDIKQASGEEGGLQFVTGTTPCLRIGGRRIDLTLSADDFRNELYLSTVAGSLPSLQYAGLPTHRAGLRPNEKKGSGTEAGTDEALAALKRNMASLEQEKQANQSHYESGLLPIPKNRSDAAKKHKRMTYDGLGSGSHTPAYTPQRDLPPTSAPVSESEVKNQAMKTAIIHLLAMKPLTFQDIHFTTHIRNEDLDNILRKIATEVDGRWELTLRAYKELNVWSFGYKTQEDRQLAIDNAIGAYDRLRLDKDNKCWQLLYHKDERGRGKTLSRLTLGAGARSGTPNPSGTPLLQTEAGGDGLAPSGANTPRLGASTPKAAGTKVNLKKLMAARDPKKAMAAQEAKVKKQKEKEAAKETREAAASDRENARTVKRQTAKKPAAATIKSAEFVQSSDDESGEEGEVIERVDLKQSPEKAKAAEKAKSTPSPESSDTPSSGTKKASAKKQADPAKSIASLATKAKSSVAASKVTPRTTTGLAALNSQPKSSRSPQKQDSRPNVPSPLGAARPRVASDVSNRSAAGVQRTGQGDGTPKGLGITHGARRRHDTAGSTDSAVSSSSDRKREPEKPAMKQHKPNGVAKSAANGVKKPSTSGASSNGAKRKADPAPEAQPPDPKHRKTTSNSSDSQTATSASTAPTSPAADSILDTITYAQGVSQAEKFRAVYYPKYLELYEEQAAKEARGERVSQEDREHLWAMHRRLEGMKREIERASRREREEE